MNFGAIHFIKGSLTRDFRLQVFSWISVPQAPKYSIFFENSRRMLIAGVNDTAEKLFTGVNDTPIKESCLY